MLYSLALATFLRDAVAKAGIEVLHAHNAHLFMPMVWRTLTRLRADGAIRALHHTVHSLPSSETAVTDGADRTYAVSSYLATAWSAMVTTPIEPFYLGVDTTRFAPDIAARSEPTNLVVLHPGRLVEEKGATLSVRMLKKLLALGYPVRLILTDTPWTADNVQRVRKQRRTVLRLVNSLGVADKVQLVRADYNSMPDLYRAADVVVYPTIGPEPLGLVPLEAMSCQLPVIVSRTGGMKETVAEGVTGLAFPQGDVDALTARTAEVLKSRRLRQCMGRAGRQHVLSRFSLFHHAEQLTSRYRDSVEGRANHADSASAVG